MATVRLAVLLAVAALLSTESLAVSHRRPFRSIKAPKETVTNYETVTPVVTHRDTRGDSRLAHPRNLHVHVPARDANYSLVLELNEVILSGGFTSRHYDEEGQEVVTKGHVNCFYQGRVEDHPDWRVTMSTCHGLQGSFGDLKDENNYFHIEPANRQDGSLEQLHVVYLDSEYKHKQGTCGTEHSHVSSDVIQWPHPKQVHHQQLRRQTVDHIVEWVTVSDNRQFLANGGNLTTTILRALALANEVDALFRPLMIRVVLVETITWTHADQITVSSDPDSLLKSFKQFKPQIPTRHDSAMLLTGVNISDSTVGIAFRRSMCSDRDSVGVTQDGGRSLTLVASTAAHELGHIFNMGHDDASRQCTCADGDQGCIMAAASELPSPTRWSSCSMSDLNDGFTTFNLDRCLSNQPATVEGDPDCGNGIREGDEICDCGSPQQCTDPCCDAATCQLASGAQCSAGPCCSDTCQFLSYGTQCRAAVGECDIEEYCPGDSGECPLDEYRQDGTPCGGGDGYCFDGRCPTHNAQCQRAFGSNKAVASCYDLNSQGSEAGNCGQANNTYVPCSVSDVECGQLQCMAGDLQANVGVAIVNSTSTVNGSVCRSFTTLPSSNVDTPSPGLVEDGTRCGDGRICLSQQCVPLPTTSQCNPVPNGQICSGNGVCNNNGQCSCNVGFVGSGCETPFVGPTPFGGPTLVTGPEDGSLTGVATAVGVILFLLVIATLIVFIVTLNYRRTPSKPNRSSFRSHFSVEYHPTKQEMDTISEDFLPNEPKKDLSSRVAKMNLSLSRDDIEIVPVRPAPQRPPSEVLTPVAQDQTSPPHGHSQTSSGPDEWASLDLSPGDSFIDISPPPVDSMQVLASPTGPLLPPHIVPELKAASKEELPHSLQMESQTQPQLPTSTTTTAAPVPQCPVRPQRRPPPVVPTKAEKPVTAPRHAAPIKPQPASRPSPAPKPLPVSVSTTEVADTPAPKPTPKPKPPVTTEKPLAKPSGAAPPKPLVKPTGLESLSSGETAPKASGNTKIRDTTSKTSVDTASKQSLQAPASIPSKPVIPTAPKPSVPTAPKPSAPTAPKPSVPTAPKPSAPTAPKSSASTSPESSVSSAAKPSAPTAPKPSVLAASKPSVPAASKPSVPTASKPPTPSKPAVPTAPKPSVPKAPKPSLPTAHKPSAPSAPKPSLPTSPKPSMPTAPKPSAPTSPKPVVPTAPKPSLPTSPKPSLPKGAKPSIPTAPKPHVDAASKPPPVTPKPSIAMTPKPSLPSTPQSSTKPPVAPRSTVPQTPQAAGVVSTSEKPIPSPRR